MKIKSTIAKENIINNAQKNQQDMQKLNLQTNTFADILSTFNMKNKNTRTTKIEQVLTKLESDIKQKNSDKINSTISAIVKLQTKRRTHSIGFAHKHDFNSHVCAPPKTFLDYKITN